MLTGSLGWLVESPYLITLSQDPRGRETRGVSVLAGDGLQVRDLSIVVYYSHLHVQNPRALTPYRLGSVGVLNEPRVPIRWRYYIYVHRQQAAAG